MEGAAEAERKAFDLAITTAWHTEAFAREKKLGKLSKYLKRQSEKRSVLSDAHSFFASMKAKGIPVKVYRTPAKDRSVVH